MKEGEAKDREGGNVREGGGGAGGEMWNGEESGAQWRGVGEREEPVLWRQ